jgi:hypothetical protein
MLLVEIWIPLAQFFCRWRHTMDLMLLSIVFYRSPFDQRLKGTESLLIAIVNEYPCDIPFVNVHCDDHGICVWERYEFDVSFGKGYGNV